MPILLAIGVVSVLQWRVSELRGAGDLRFYALVQLYAVLFLLIALFLPSRYTRGPDLAIIAGFYMLAKILEALDRPIFEVGHIVSGHTLKHLASACGGYWILRMLLKRRPIDVIHAGRSRAVQLSSGAEEPPRESAPRNPERYRPLAPRH